MESATMDEHRSISVGPLGLNQTALGRWTIYALAAFPMVDYALRFAFGPLHILGVLWDKLALLVLLVLATMRYIAGFRPQWPLWTKFAGWFMLLGLGIMFAGFVNPSVSVAGYKVDVYYILFALLIPFIVSREDVPKLLHTMAMLAILISIHSIYQYITKAPNPRGWTDPSESVRTRVYSVLQSPNELGAYMALMTPLLAGLAFYDTHRWRKWLYRVGVFLCGIALLLTFTRGAWLALVAAVIIMALLFDWRLLIVVIVLSVVAFFLPPIHHRIMDLLSPVHWIKDAQAGRTYRWMLAFDRMSSSPLFGAGLGRFGGSIASQTYGGPYSDNYYAKTLAETGIVGLTLYVAMHLAILRDVFRRARLKSLGRARYVLLGGATGLLAVMIHNFTENVFEYAPMLMTYLLLAVLLLIWASPESEQRTGQETLLQTTEGEQA